MRPSHSLIRAFTFLTSLISTAATADEIVRLDLAGDPLPPGALLRLGVTRLRHGSMIMAAAWSPDGKTVVTGDGTLKAWDTSTGSMRWQASDGMDLTYHHVAFSPDGTLLACSGGQQPIQIRDPATGRLLYSNAPASEAVFDNYGPIAFSSDGKSLWSLRHKGVLCRFVLDACQSRLDLERPTGCGYGLVASPTGDTLACWQGNTLRLVDSRTAEGVFVKTGADNFWSLDFSPDGKLLAAGCEDYSIQVWDVPSGSLVFQRQAVHGPWRPWVHFVGRLPAVLASSGSDGIVRLWDIRQDRETKTIQAQPGEAIPSPDGQRVCLCHAGSGGISFWDTTTGQENPRLLGHTIAVTSLAFSPDGSLLATAAENDFTLRLWDLSTGEQLKQFSGSSRNLRFSADGRSIIADQTKQRFLFGIDGRRETLGEELPHHSQLILSHDGKLLVVSAQWLKPRPAPEQAFDWRVALQAWDLPERRLRWEIKDLPTSIVGFLPEGNRFVGVKAVPAEGRSRFVATVWDGESDAELLAIPGHEPLPPDPKKPKGLQDIGRFPPHPKLVVSDDGTLLAMIEGTFPLRVFELPSGKLLREFKRDAKVKSFNLKGRFSPDNRFLMLGDQRFEILDLNTGETLTAFGSPIAQVLSADGRLLATAREDGTLQLWDFVDQKLLATTKIPNKHPVMAFAPDAKTLAVATREGAVLIYSTDPKTWLPIAEAEPPVIVSNDPWQTLGGNATEAWTEIERLAAQPDVAVAILRKRLHPEAPDVALVQGWIAQLSDTDEAKRRAAAAELARRGSSIAIQLQEASNNAADPHAKRSLAKLLAALDFPFISSEHDLRRHRAIQVLERIGTAEAIGLLRELGERSSSEREKREVAAALQRHSPSKEASP